MPGPLPQRDLCEEDRDWDWVNPDAINALVHTKTLTEAAAVKMWTQPSAEKTTEVLSRQNSLIEVTGLWLSYLDVIQTNQNF